MGRSRQGVEEEHPLVDGRDQEHPPALERAQPESWPPRERYRNERAEEVHQAAVPKLGECSRSAGSSERQCDERLETAQTEYFQVQDVPTVKYLGLEEDDDHR